MRHVLATTAFSGLTLLVYLLCLPLVVVWFAFWILVGSIFQPPDRIANRYFRLAVWPLLLPLCLLPEASTPEVRVSSNARVGQAMSSPKVAGVYA